MKSFLYSLLALAIFSCETDDNKIEEYQIFSMKSGPENSRTIDSMCYFSFFEDDKKIYEYRSLEGDRSYFFRFEKKIDNDSVFRLFNTNCKLVDSKVFQFKNEDIIVFKYKYDILGKEDEETDYFFTKEYGLILLESTAWRNVNVIINEEEFKPLQDSIRLNKNKFKSSYNLKTATETKN